MMKLNSVKPHAAAASTEIVFFATVKLNFKRDPAARTYGRNGDGAVLQLSAAHRTDPVSDIDALSAVFTLLCLGHAGPPSYNHK
jgi:hypothetical protein